MTSFLNIIDKIELLRQSGHPQATELIKKFTTEIDQALSTESQQIDNPALSPGDLEKRQELSPEVREVVEVVNMMLSERLQGNSCYLKQKDIITKRCEVNGRARNSFNFARLDVMERLFRLAGWKVSYDKPGYNESYDANFTFTKIQL